MESPLCRPETRLIETFGWDGARFARLDAHLARARASAAVLGFAWNADAIARALGTIGGAEPLRVRLTLGRAGDAEVTAAPLPPTPPAWQVMIGADRLDPAAPLLHHKTTERAAYDAARAALPPGMDEVLFLNDRDEVCEGTISNVFLADGAMLLTPPLVSGCLPGILRAELLATGRAREAVLSLSDLGTRPWYMGNALRGLIPARIAG
ncbi:MAG: aminotransferase class IV [Rhodobacteraceae bacterium]|nr:aminotransferase class IV [Paracoccaceae bacterium]